MVAAKIQKKFLLFYVRQNCADEWGKSINKFDSYGTYPLNARPTVKSLDFPPGK
jgi:hypothetical protein